MFYGSAVSIDCSMLCLILSNTTLYLLYYLQWFKTHAAVPCPGRHLQQKD